MVKPTTLTLWKQFATTVEWTWWRHRNACHLANFRDDRSPQVAKTTTDYKSKPNITSAPRLSTTPNWRLQEILWRAEIWWCPRRLLNWMPFYQIVELNSGVWWILVLDIRCLWPHNTTPYSYLLTNVLAKFVDTSVATLAVCC